MQRSVVLLHHSLPFFLFKLCLINQSVIQFCSSKFQEEKEKSKHTCKCLKKKKSPDFKTAYLRNDKYCTTMEAYTFQSWTKAFQPYELLFQCFKVFPQSFHYGFCNIMAINLEVSFNTMYKNYKMWSYQLYAASGLTELWRAQPYPVKEKLNMLILPASSQSAVPSHSEERSRLLWPHCPLSIKLVASEANLTAWHSCSAYSRCLGTSLLSGHH